MNISQTESPVRLVANTCGRRDKNIVTYCWFLSILVD